MRTTCARWLSLICFGIFAFSIHAFSHGQDVAPVADDAEVKRRAKAVIDVVSPAIVRFAYGKERKLHFGCGVLVSADGHVAISGPVQSVVDDELLELRLADGRLVRGRALGWSSEFGFGMLKISETGPWPHVGLNSEARVGEVCVALGYARNSAAQSEDLHPDVRLGLVTKSSDGHWLTTSHRSRFTAHPVFDLNSKLLGLTCKMPLGGDPLQASADLIAAHWDELVAGKNLDLVRLSSDSPEDRRPKANEIDAEAIARAKEASVRISVLGETESLASGVIVSADGYVITCGHHGRMPGEKLSLSLRDGRTTPAIVLGTNLVSDVGVLKLTTDGPWPHAEMGHSATMEVGEPCVLIGYPRTKPGPDPLVFETQLINPTQTLPRRDEWYCEFWTFGFPESMGGASGGGVFDAKGQVIGVLLGGAGEEMQNSRVELFRKNWSTLSASQPVWAVEASLVTDTRAKLDRIAVELTTKDNR